MSDAKFAKGPWCFEPHNMYGLPLPIDVEDVEPWPFGYLSHETPRVPIFELRPIVEIDPGVLRSVAYKISAADLLYEALSEAVDRMTGSSPSITKLRTKAIVALHKARGEP